MLMPFENRTVMEQRIEFVLLAEASNRVKIKDLCSRFILVARLGINGLIDTKMVDLRA